MDKKILIIGMFVVLLVMGGSTLIVTVNVEAGLYLIVLGLFLAILQVLDVRRAKRAKQNTCPQCGQIMVEGSKLCTNCGFEIE